MEEPNVWATSTKRGEQFYKQIQIFAEVFLDPDGDGVDYVEIHINPLNNVYDLHLTHDKRIVPLKYHFNGRNYEWDCSGLETAVYVEGTINNPDDRDKYWSLEMAIPWNSLSPFTLGKCPPAPGDKWAALIGRTYHLNPAKKDRIYGTWPVVGEHQTHFLDKWGFILFSNDSIDKTVVKEISPEK